MHDLPKKKQDIFERLHQTPSSSSDEFFKSVLSVEIGGNQLTDIFNIPLIPGPASDFRAIYTALMCTQGISI